MRITSWLNSLRSDRSRKHSRRAAAHEYRAALVRQTELLEDRTLLSALVIDAEDLTTTPGAGRTITIDDLIGNGDQANPQFDSIVIESSSYKEAGIDITIDGGVAGITLKSIVIESVDIADYTGNGINIDLTNVDGLRHILLENVTAHGTGGAAVNVKLTDTDLFALTTFDSELDGYSLLGINSKISHARIAENTLTGGAGVEGLKVQLTAGSTADDFLVIDNQKISSATNDAVLFDFDGASSDGLVVKGNEFSATFLSSTTFNVDGNTFNQPFSITNSATSTQRIQRIVWDVSPAGLVFDTNAGTGQPFAAVAGSGAATGQTPAPTIGATTLDMSFTDFDAGETFQWDIDLDLFGTQSAVTGDQLIGSTVTITFADGTTAVGVFVSAGPNFPDAARLVFTSSNTGANGVVLDLTDSPVTGLLIADNKLNGTRGDGLLVKAVRSDITGDIIDNEVTANANHGMKFDTVDSNYTGRILRNTVDGNGKMGISFSPSVGTSGTVGGLAGGLGQLLTVNSPGHGLQPGDQVVIAGVSGTGAGGVTFFGGANVANGVHTVGAVTGNTFQLVGTAANASYVGGGSWFKVDEAGSVTAATSPAVGDITVTSAAHGLTDGDRVTVTNAGGDLGLNGTFLVTVIDANTFSLDGSKSLGTYTNGGVWFKSFIIDLRGGVNDNQFNANSGAGMTVDLPDGTVLLANFSHNVFKGNGGVGLGINATAGVFDVKVGTGLLAGQNVFEGNVGAGLAVEVLDTATGAVEILNNLFVRQQNDPNSTHFNGDGLRIRLDSSVNGNIDATSSLSRSLIQDNTFGADNLGNAGSGVSFSMHDKTTIDTLQAIHNSYVNNLDDGFKFFRRDDAELNSVLVSESTFEGNQNDGIEMFAQNTTRDLLDWVLRNNEITNNGVFGIRLKVEVDARIQVNLFNNTVDFNGVRGGGGGIGLTGFQQVEVHMDMENNRIRQNIGDGVSVDTPLPADSMKLVGRWINNTYSNNTGHGVRTLDVSFGSLTWLDNHFDANRLNGAQIAFGDDFDIFGTNNTFVGNVTGHGLSIGPGVNVAFGDGTASGQNLFDGNGADGVHFDAGSPFYLAGLGRFHTGSFNKNTFRNNGQDGFDAEGADDLEVAISNSIISGNTLDGVEWRGVSNTSSLAILNSQITNNGGVGANAGGRGIDILQSGFGHTNVTILDSIVKSNALEGIFVVQSASVNQLQGTSNDPLLADGWFLGNPSIRARIRNNKVESNGTAIFQSRIPTIGTATTTIAGTLGGIVVRVGSTSSDGHLGEGVAPEDFDNDLIAAAQLANPSRVEAEIVNNFVAGNVGSEFYFDAFISTGNPPTTTGFWRIPPVKPKDPLYLVRNLWRDPLSRFDLVFRLNTTQQGNSLDISNVNGAYTNSEGTFKSRTFGQRPPGPFISATRPRSITRTVGGPMVVGDGSGTVFGFDGVGRSTWRVESDFDVDPRFNIDGAFGFSDFAVGFADPFEGNTHFSWDLGGDITDPLSLQPGQVFGAIVQHDRFEVNDSFLSAHDLGDAKNVNEAGLTIHSTSDEDFFKFTATDNRLMTLDLVSNSFLGDLNFALYEFDPSLSTEEVLVAAGATVGNIEHMEWFLEEGKTYFIRIYDLDANGVKTINTGYTLTTDVPVPPPTGVPVDIYEQNDTFPAATNLGNVVHFLATDLTIHAFGNQDFYQFTANANGFATIEITSLDAATDLNFVVYTSPLAAPIASTNIGVGVGGANHETLTLVVQAGVTYRVQVFEANGLHNTVRVFNADWDTYTLSIEAPLGPDRFDAPVAAPLPVGQIDPAGRNDTIAAPDTATNFGDADDINEFNLSLHSTNTFITAADNDYYKFVAAGTGDVIIDVTSFSADGFTPLPDATGLPGATANITIELYDGGNLIATANTVSNIENLTFAVRRGRTYFIRVFDANGLDVHEDYSLSIDAPLAPDKWEVNDHPTANEADKNADWKKVANKTFNNLSIHVPGDVDYYKFTADKDGDITIRMTSNSATGDLDIALFDQTGGGAPIDEDVFFGNTGIVRVFNAKKGDVFYIRVFDASGVTNPNYRIQITTVVPPPLMGPDGPSTTTTTITDAELASIVEEAISRWETTGLSEAQLASLRAVSIEMHDFAGSQLASATRSLIRLDVNAGGHGWFIDTTPDDDDEFNSTDSASRLTTTDGDAAGKIDLLTTVMHEFGHVLGLHDLNVLTSQTDVMAGVLSPGERRLPIVGQANGVTVDENYQHTALLASAITVDAAGDTQDANVGDDIVADAVGNRTLRAAIMEANASAGADVINITAGTIALTITNSSTNELAEGDLDITDDLVINGEGIGITIIDATALLDRIFHIHANTTVTLSNMTITNGDALIGAGILNEGTLILDNVNIVDNTAIRGAGIYNTGTLSITDSTIADNTADSRGGALFNKGGGSAATLKNSTLSGNYAGSRGGAIFNEGQVSLFNSTVSGNEAVSRGGGIYNDGAFTAVSSTIAFNTAQVEGGGIMNIATRTANLQNTIVAKNSVVDVANGHDLFGTFTTFGGNLIGESTGSAGFVHEINGDQVGGGAFIPVIDPQLLPLDNYGGPTETHMLALTSPARDAGKNANPADFDQRGFSRVTNGDNDGIAKIDVGAVEANTFVTGGRVWQDKDGDGVQDAGEPGMANVTVSIFNAGADGNIGGGDDTLAQTTTTDSQGNYEFRGLDAGAYYIHVAKPADHTYTTADVGGDDTIDSDVNQTTGNSVVFILNGSGAILDRDAGFVPDASSISGVAFNDTNNNGIQDAGELGVAGAIVRLFSPGADGVAGTGDDVFLQPALTNGDGEYIFNGLIPNSYFVVFDTVIGKALTLQDQGADDTKDSDANPYHHRTDIVVVTAGSDHDTIDAGYVTEAVLGNFVFVDNATTNGIQDGGEAGQAGIGVTLYEAGADGAIGGGDDTLIGTVTTDVNGEYNFSQLAAGNYYLHFTKPANFAFTTQQQGGNTALDSDVDPATQNTTVFALATGQTDETRDAGITNQASIGDRVWKDTNRDGNQDAGELGVANVTVELYSAGADGQIGGGDDTLIATTTTDANGNYQFDGLSVGKHYLTFVEPQNLDFTTQNAAADNVDSDVNTTTGQTAVFTLTAGSTNNDFDAGLVNETQVGNRVWLDDNNNGVQEVSETDGVENVIVKIWSPGVDGAIGGGDDQLVSQTTTDANGNYLIGELASGKYYLEFITPNGFSFTQQGQANRFQDSNPDPLTGKTDIFELTAGQVDLTHDAGLVTSGDIAGRVWKDSNQDGIESSNQTQEPGVAGVQVELLHVGVDGVVGGGDDVLVKTTNTDSAGNYSFINLSPQTYYVRFVAPIGFIFTTQNQGGNDAVDSDANSLGVTAAIPIAAGQINNTVDAGLQVSTDARVGNLVFNDLNGDGIQQANEPGIAGVQVTLFSTGNDGNIGGGDDNLIKTVTTDSNGEYGFTNLAPGKYYAAFGRPTGMDFTAQDQGSDDSLDSDANQQTGLTTPFTLIPSENNQTIDVGLVQRSAVPDQPVLTGPALSSAETKPTITWDAASGATSYDLLLYNTRLGKELLNLTGIIGTSFTVPNDLLPDTYQVFVRGKNSAGTSSFSAARNFTVSGAVSVAPKAPTITGPSSTITDTTPKLTWTTSVGATHYEIFLYDTKLGQEILRENVTGTEFTVPQALNLSRFQMLVRAVNAAGNSNFGTSLFFTIVDGPAFGKPTVTGPTGTTSDATPTITWTSVAGATSYDLLVYNIQQGKEVVNQKNISAANFTIPTQIPGDYQVFVRAVNASQTTAFSTAHVFEIVSSTPSSVPTLTGPAPITTDHTPTYTWSAVAGATSYELLVYNRDAGQEILDRKQIIGTQFTHPVHLPGANYEVFVRAITASGPTAFSRPLHFQVVGTTDLLNQNVEQTGPQEIPQNSVLAGDTDLQFVMLLDNDAPFETSHTETADAKEEQETSATNRPDVPETNGRGIKMVRGEWNRSQMQRGRGKTAASQSGTEEAVSLDNVMADWHNTDWWTDENSLSAVEELKTEEPALGTTEQTPLVTAGASVAGVLAALSARSKKSSSQKKNQSRKRS